MASRSSFKNDSAGGTRQKKVMSYDPTADENALDRAYVFAMKAHGAQVRASGDPYFSHPLEVAAILADYKLDSRLDHHGSAARHHRRYPGDVGRY